MMNGTENNQSDRRGGPGKDALDELFRHVSARQRPPAQDEEAVRATLHGQWQDMVRQGKRKRRAWVWGMAASLALAVVIGNQARQAGSSPALSGSLAVVTRVQGEVTVAMNSNKPAIPARVDERLLSGQTLRTESGSALKLVWKSGASLILDERTELRLISGDEVYLSSGRVYLDAPPDSGNAPVTIATRQGRVRHLGTQFMAEISASGLSVSVREGEVTFLPDAAADSGQVLAVVGQQLSVSPDGAIEFKDIQTWGKDWAWTEALSSGFDSDGRSLAELLAWAGRETGRQVIYQSGGAKSMAESTVLHGTLDLDPEQALSVVSATSDLLARAEQGYILVTTQSAD